MPDWRRYRDFLRENPQRDLADEVQFHLETETEEQIAAGLSPEEARRRTLARFGDVDRTLAECRASDARRLKRRNRLRLFDTLRHDVRYAFRGLVRQPAFASAAILVVALGVGANASIFSVVDHLFLRPPAGVEKPEELRRIFVIRQRDTGAEYFQVRFPLPEARAIDSSIAEAFPSTTFFRRDVPVELEPGASRSMSSGWVSPSFFTVLGVKLLAGSDFGPESARFGVPAASAIISWSFWQREFAGDRGVLGRTIRVDGNPVTIRGVTPRGFTGIDVGVTDVWMPLAGFTGYIAQSGQAWHEDWRIIAFRVLARVPRGVSDEQLVMRVEAGARVSAESFRLAEPGGRSRDKALRVIPAPLLTALGPEPMSHRETIAAVLAGLAVLLLVIAIANVGNLLLGRALDRQREIAIRTALGMTRLRLLIHVVIESLLLAAAATVAAVVAATWMGAVLRSMLLPRVELGVGPVDLRVMLLATFLGLATALAASVVPLGSMLPLDLTQRLKTGSREGGGRRSRLRSSLVGVQAALSVVLLVGTGLLARSLHNVRTVDLGLDVDNVISVRALDERGEARLAELARLAGSLPGVAGSALAATPPLWDQLEAKYLFTRQADTIRPPETVFGVVPAEPGYLGVVGTRLVRGRDFSPDDRFAAPPVVIVSEELARHVWRSVDPLGQCLRIESAEAACRTVIGVVANAHKYEIIENPQAVLYLPLDQRPDRQAGSGTGATALVVRTHGTPTAVATRLRAELQDTATTLRGRQVVVLSELLEPQYDSWELGARLFAGLAALALVLAFCGLYGVLSYLVTLRKRELGVRLALGADRRGVLALVIREGVRQIAIGALVGVVIALVAGPQISSLLFRTAPRDPAVILAAVLALIMIAALAALIPGRRAMTIDPMRAIRED
jgi:predicted permease